MLRWIRTDGQCCVRQTMANEGGAIRLAEEIQQNENRVQVLRYIKLKTAKI